MQRDETTWGSERDGELRLLRSIVENANDAILVTEGTPIEEPGPRIIYVNGTFTRMTGYTLDDVRGQTPRILQGPDTDPEPRRKIREALQWWKPVQVELLNYRKDGTPFWVELNIVPVFDDDGLYTHWISVQRETTERRRAEEEARKREERLRASLTQNASDIVTIVDANGGIRYASPSVLKALGFKPEEMVGTDISFYVHPDDLERTSGAFADRLDKPGVGKPIEMRLRRKNGSWRFFEAVANNLLEDPSVEGLVVNAWDVTGRRELEERLAHQALHDGLTNLPNRTLLLDRLGHALARARRRGEKVAVLFLDLDNFKYVNDSLGHRAGDKLIVGVATRLQSCLRPGDTAARLGGDEFVVLLEDVRDARDAGLVARRIAEALRTPFVVDGHELFVSTSVGVAMDGTDDGPGDLLKNADLAMYRAKEEGKDGHAVFEPGMSVRAQERLGVEGALRRALEGGGEDFAVHYQPKVSLATGGIVGFEALVRWEHPQRGLVAPAEFIPVAEETGLISPLGKWVLREACRQAHEWHELYPADDPPLTMSVNLSARQFRQADLVGTVAEILGEAGLDPESLILEITESTVMEDAQANAETLRELKALGVRIAIDDFGTGYSSLAYLKRFPVDFLKIDRSFVDGLGEDADDEGIVSSVVNLARTLNLRAVAEGVETEEQRSRLRSMNCELAQGFYFSEPSTAQDASALLKDRHS